MRPHRHPRLFEHPFTGNGRIEKVGNTIMPYEKVRPSALDFFSSVAHIRPFIHILNQRRRQ